MEIGTPACSIRVKVVCLESCRVIRRSPARLSSRRNSSEYHSGWTGVPAWSVITYSPPWYQCSPASTDRYAAPAGERLPAETALLDRFRAQFPTLSLPTLRQAIGLLRSEGLIGSRHGVGTFVTTSHRLQRRSRKRYGRVRADWQLLTSHLDHEILFAGHTTVPAHISDTGAFSPGEEVIARQRLLRDKDTGRPEELGVSYVPLAIGAGSYLEQTDVAPQALFLCVEELSGRRYAYARDQWTVRAAGPDESDLLSLASQDRMHEQPETIAHYRPHVSVAYINAAGPAQPIVSALQSARPGPVTTALGSASVLTFHRDNRMYEWTAATRLPIG